MARFQEVVVFASHRHIATRSSWEGGGVLKRVPQGTEGSLVFSPYLELGFEGDGPFWPLTEEDMSATDWLIQYLPEPVVEQVVEQVVVEEVVNAVEVGVQQESNL